MMRRALMLTTCLAFSFSALAPSAFSQTVQQKQQADSKRKNQEKNKEAAKARQEQQAAEQNQGNQKRAQEILAAAEIAGNKALGFFGKIRHHSKDTQAFFSTVAEELEKEQNQIVKRLVLTQLAKEYGNDMVSLPEKKSYEKTSEAIKAETANLAKEIRAVKKGTLKEADKAKIKQQVKAAVQRIEMTAANVKEHATPNTSYQKPEPSKLPELKSVSANSAKQRVDALTKKWGGRTENTMTGYAAQAYVGFYTEAMAEAKKIMDHTERDFFLTDIKKKYDSVTKDNTPLREWGTFSSPEAKTSAIQKLKEELGKLTAGAKTLAVEHQTGVLASEKSENIDKKNHEAAIGTFLDDLKSLEAHLMNNMPLHGNDAEAMKALSGDLAKIPITKTHGDINLEGLKKIKELLDQHQNIPGMNSIGLVTKLQAQIEPLETARAIKTHNKITDKSINSLDQQATSLRQDASVSKAADVLKATAIIESVLDQKKNDGYLWKADAYAENYQAVVDKLGAEPDSVQRAAIEQLEASARQAKLGSHKKKVEAILDAKKHELHLTAVPVTPALAHTPLERDLVKPQEKLFHPEGKQGINPYDAPYQARAKKMIEDVKAGLDKSGKTDFKAYTRFYEEIEKKMKDEPDQAVRLQAQLLAGNELREYLKAGNPLKGWVFGNASKDAQEKIINEFGGKTAPENAKTFAEEHIKKLETAHHAKSQELKADSAAHATLTHQTVAAHAENMANVHKTMQQHLEVNHPGNTKASQALAAITQAHAKIQAQIAEHAQAKTLMTKEQAAAHIADLQAARNAHFASIPNDAGSDGHKAAMLAQHEALIASLMAHQQAIENHNEHMEGAVNPHAQAAIVHQQEHHP